MSFLTSFCDLPQNEQRRVSSARLTMSWGTPFRLRVVSGLTSGAVALISRLRSLLATEAQAEAYATRGARSPRLLNHIPWPGQQINIDRVPRRVRSARDSDQYVWQEFARSAREYV